MTPTPLESTGSEESGTEKWKKQFFLVLSTAGIPLVFMFGVIDIMEKDFGEFFIDIINMITLVACFIGIIKNFPTKNIFLFGIFVLHITVLSNIAIGAGESTALFWAFILPPFAFTFLTRTMGILLTSVSSLLLTFMVLHPGVFGLHIYGFSSGFRFLLAYAFSLVFVYSFASSRYHYEKKLSGKHSKIEENRDFLNSLLETIPNPVYFKDINGLYIGCNRAFEKLVGRSREEFMGKTIFDIGFSRNADVHWKQEQELLKKSGTLSYQHPTVNKNGVATHLIFTKSVFYDKAGNIIGVIGVVTDITELKKTQDILEKSETRFRTLVEQASDAMFLYDINGKIKDVNQRACASLGYTREELLQMDIPSIDPDYDVKKLNTALKRVLEGENIRVNGIHTKKDGSTFPVEVAVGYYPGDNESLFLGLARDITDRTKADMEKEKLIAQLQTALAEMKTLRGFLPICSICKNVRDDKGYWSRIEAYLSEHTYAELSQSICPDCAKNHPPHIKVHE